MSEVDNNSTLPEPFVRVLLANQGTLYAYIVSLLGDPSLAEEVLQETNVVLCRQADQFPEIKDFSAWACRIAYYEVLSYRKRRQRDRHTFDDELLGLIANQAAPRVQEFDQRQTALTECLGRLSQTQREIIIQRYAPNGSVQKIAEKHGRSPGAISQSLYRIRDLLLRCMRDRLAVAE
ncbi:MAG: sigma-70 family RNA polymerase sigma factor [Pirellulales bacterium]|nr:sigma-70 family RNA polymerase sigma factor [Pirellulales bacterium]